MSDTTPPLRDYQDRGVDWIVGTLQTHRAALLADEAGLGKTRQALTAAHKLRANNILIVCPAGARRVWEREIRRWMPAWSRRLVLVEPGQNHARTASRLDEHSKPLLMVVGYDEFSNARAPFIAQLARRSWDLLILDEAHYCKNPSNRTHALYGSGRGYEKTAGVQASAAKVLLLTGTPTPNHAGELWQHYRTLWPDILGRPLSLPEFEERFTRYKDTVFGRQVVGSKNQPVLREALKPVVLRRRKDQVLKELPPLILQDVPLTVGVDYGRNTRASLARNYGRYGADHSVVKSDEGADARAESVSATSFGAAHAGEVSTRAASSGRYVSSVDRAAVELAATLTDDDLLRVLRQPDAALTTLRRELGELKVKPTVTWVQERLASTSKLLLFAWHHSVIAHLAQGLTEFMPVVVTGETSPQRRVSAVDQFQTDPRVRVFIGQVLAAGTAVTLTAANEVAVVEPSWVPGENIQAICRAHRLGQRDSVLASFLFLPGTLDERIMQVFRRKAAEINELEGV